MTRSTTFRPQGRPTRALLAVLLLGTLAAALAVLGPGLLAGLRFDGGTLLAAPECVVQTPNGEIGLDREEAKIATTAVALRARGVEAPDTTSIDGAALTALAEGPSGDVGPVLSCRGLVDEDLQVEEMTAPGLTPRGEHVRTAMTEVFGEQSLGGFAPGGVGQGHGEESTHYDGRAIDVFFRPVSEENRRAGWMLSHWLVAHAEDLNIQYVIFDDRFWSAHIGRGQWHPYDAPAPSNEILRHVDHVHVDVLRGGDG